MMKSHSEREIAELAHYAALPSEHAKAVVKFVMEHLADRPIRSAEAFRNAITSGGLAVNPLLDIRSEVDARFLQDMIRKAVIEGRMIDFGFIPNEVIRMESVRSRQMFESGELIHPFDSWVATSRWEGGFNGYYISPHPQWPGAILVIELYGVNLDSKVDVILIYDMVSIKVNGPHDTIVSPAIMNFSNHVQTEAEMRARGSNCLDPLVMMLRLLADASIPVTYHEEPVRLNKARVKQGKSPIPAHTTVETKDYVSNFLTVGKSGSKGSSKGGHHASPIAHWRRSHMRHLANGKVIPVKSSKVNWRDNEELHRIFYRMK